MRPTIDDLDSLTRPREGLHVSLYLPTHRRGTEIRQDPIRLRNLVRDVRRRLADEDVRAADVDGLIEPAEALAEDATFWRYREEGLALFSASSFFRHYDLPAPCEELAVVSHRFHVTPLVPLLSGNGRFYLLALGLGETRAFECTRETIRQVEIEGMPGSLQEALVFDEGEPQLQLHTRTSPSPFGRRAAMFHGHGGGEEDARPRQLRFCQLVDAALRRRIGSENAPLLLAALDQLQAMYRDASHYSQLLPDGVSGNPEGTRPESLHRKAWELVQPRFDRPRIEALEGYRRLATSNRERTAHEIEKIVPAAWHGRVDTLFVGTGLRRWGTFDPESGRVELHEESTPANEDLLDLASVHTLAKRGAVYPIAPEDLPADGPAAAILRF
jgi:hypothetical protein